MVDVALTRISVEESKERDVAVAGSSVEVDLAKDDGCALRFASKGPRCQFIFTSWVVPIENEDTKEEDGNLRRILDWDSMANIVAAAYMALQIPLFREERKRCTMVLGLQSVSLRRLL